MPIFMPMHDAGECRAASGSKSGGGHSHAEIYAAEVACGSGRLKLAGSVKLRDAQQQKRKEEIYDGQQMAWEVRELKFVVESMDCPIVLSHLDLLANNIFVPADSQVSG